MAISYTVLCGSISGIPMGHPTDQPIPLVQGSLGFCARNIAMLRQFTPDWDRGMNRYADMTMCMHAPLCSSKFGVNFHLKLGLRVNPGVSGTPTFTVESAIL